MATKSLPNISNPPRGSSVQLRMTSRSEGRTPSLRPEVWRRIELEPLRNLFFVFSFVSLVAFVILDLQGSGYVHNPLDKCVIDRFEKPGTPLLPKGVAHMGAVFFLIVCILQVLFWRSKPEVGTGALVNATLGFDLAISIIWFCGTHSLGVFLKHYVLSDETCNVHANGISGHFIFFVYYGLLLGFLPFHGVGGQYALPSRSQSKWYSISYLLYLGFSGCTMYDTYFGGYHSLRQIIYGVIVAVASISALVALFDAALKNNRWMLMFYGSEHGNEALTFLAISFFFTMLGLAWGFGRTPFSTTELLMIFLVWCVLVYCYDFYPKGKPNRHTA